MAEGRKVVKGHRKSDVAPQHKNEQQAQTLSLEDQLQQLANIIVDIYLESIYEAAAGIEIKP